MSSRRNAKQWQISHAPTEKLTRSGSRALSRRYSSRALSRRTGAEPGLAVWSEQIGEAPPPPSKAESARGAILIGLLVCLLFFGGLTAWSLLAPLDSAAVAPGKVRVETNRMVLDHPDGGTIAALHVREGDHVTAGDVLLRLDTTRVQAQLSMLERRQDALTTLRARLQAEAAGAPRVDYPEDLRARAVDDAELTQMIATQNSLFNAAQEAFDGEIEISQQKIDQLEDRVDGLTAQLQSLKTQKDLIAEERADLEILLAKGLTPQTRVLALRREEARMEGQIGELQASLAETRAQIGETRLSTLQLSRNRLATTSETLRSSLSELLEIAPQIEALRSQLARRELKAPASGIVFGLTKFTTGGVIQSGEPILSIVPAQSPLVVEAQISLVDRDVVRAGMPARIRFTSFNFRTSEPVPATVLRVSADAVSDESNGTSYYTAVLEVAPEALAAQNLTLEPGMPAEAIIPLGARTPVQYLLEPLLRNWEKALREE
ncbi:MAG: HlyD family type I secretion periplasmic adaptor subunit [Neomegalonema sp.]|nr:HlyD family type I secretion periplasmic adaptor subunit [Neomegalonema sp.]